MPADDGSVNIADTLVVLNNGLELLNLGYERFIAREVFSDGTDIILLRIIDETRDDRDYVKIEVNERSPTGIDLSYLVTEIRFAEARVRKIPVTETMRRKIAYAGKLGEVPGWYFRPDKRLITCGDPHNPIAIDDCTQLSTEAIYTIMKDSLRRHPKVR